MAKTNGANVEGKNTFITSKGERAGYYSYFIGQNLIYILVSSFLSVYYVQKLGIPAGVVGTILLVARVWDAINDPMLSVIVEKSKLKGGKFKPWINAVAILVPIATILLFSFTNFLVDANLTVKVIFASVTYIAWGMLYTISDAPAFALATVMTPNLEERNSIISLSKTFAFVGIVFAMIAAMPIVNGTSWFIAGIFFSVIAFVLMLQVRRCKERVVSTQQSPTLSDILKAIFSNRYLVIFVITIVFSMGFNFGQSLSALIAADVFGDSNLTGIMMMATMFPMLFVAPFTPKLIQKFGKLNLYKFYLITTIVFSLVIYFIGYSNFTIFLVLSVIRSILTGYGMIIPTLFFADCVEYYYYSTGKRFEAATFSAQTFSNKAMGAIGGAGGMWLIALFGYVESTGGEAVVQSQRTIDGMWAVNNLGPAVGAAISLFVFWKFYDLSEKKLAEMKKAAGK